MTDTGSQLTMQPHFSLGTDISFTCTRPFYSNGVLTTVAWCMFPDLKMHVINILMHDVGIGIGV